MNIMRDNFDDAVLAPHIEAISQWRKIPELHNVPCLAEIASQAGAAASTLAMPALSNDELTATSATAQDDPNRLVSYEFASENDDESGTDQTSLSSASQLAAMARPTPESVGERQKDGTLSPYRRPLRQQAVEEPPINTDTAFGTWL